MSTDAKIPEGKLAGSSWPWTGLAARLFALVLIAILPALAIQAYNEVTLKRSRETEVRTDALRLAKFAAGELDRIIDNGRTLLVALAHYPAVRNRDAKTCSDFFAGLSKVFPQYLAMGAIDLNGRIFCASLPIPPGISAVDRPYFKEAIASNKFVVGEYSIGRLAHKPLLPLLLPFAGPDGHIAGVVYISLDIDWLARYFQSDREVNKDATLAIADHNGIILVRLPDNADYVGTKFAKVYQPYIFAKEPGTADIVGIDGIHRILGYVPVTSSPAPGLYVGVGLTTATAFAAINAASKIGFILIALGLALGLLLAWLGGLYFISRPIESLVRASRHWSRGDFATRANLGRGGSEIIQLGRTFDDMASELQLRQQDNTTLLATLESRVEERMQVLQRAQAELQEANVTLETQARELAAANRELRSEMERREQAEETLRHLQKIEALGQLTGGVAHDFNNLLQVILGSLDAAHRRLQRGESITAESGWEQVQPAIRSAERAAVLTQQLLAFARRQPLSPQTLDLNRLVSGMSELLRRSLGETIAIETVLAGGLWPVSADAGQLENAVINLAVNARDAMPNGGKLTIETTNAFLDEAYASAHEEALAGQYVMLAISDNGVGMTPKVIKQAFDPFFTTKDVGQGTGLGLSQVYGFIKQSGGHVKIYSEPGQGTTVKMYLPRLVSAETAPEISMQPDPTLGGNKAEVILVVEDEADVRYSTVGMLEELGYTVLQAEDGATALGLLGGHPEIRLLFTDVGLPGGINGRQLVERVRVIRPEIKVLYTTGYARNAIVHNGTLDAGVELMVKPFTFAALAAKIRTML
jgi:signal transduction histidine kinase